MTCSLMRLKDKVAIITGSGRGIGRATAELFAKEGAAVIVNGRTATEVHAVADGIRARGAQAEAVVADVAASQTPPDLIAVACQKFGGLDILVNNAAVARASDFVREPFDEWRKVLEINLLAAVRLAREAAAWMVRQARPGRIVNVSSVHGFLAVELAPHGILVNGVAPGFVNTAMSIADGVNELETDTFRQIYVQRRRIPLARAAPPQEIAPLILFLAGPENTDITGQTVIVDGGLSITF